MQSIISRSDLYGKENLTYLNILQININSLKKLYFLSTTETKIIKLVALHVYRYNTININNLVLTFMFKNTK